MQKEEVVRKNGFTQSKPTFKSAFKPTANRTTEMHPEEHRNTLFSDDSVLTSSGTASNCSDEMAEELDDTTGLPHRSDLTHQVSSAVKSMMDYIQRRTRHLKRLRDSAHALAFEAIPSPEEITVAIMATLVANGMSDGAHARVTLTRGKKTTSSMNPRFNVLGCTLIVLAEAKEVGGAATYDNTKGVTLITASNRRNPSQCLDSGIHHNNMLNNIIPKIQANQAGAADAVMLDVDGFVSETNATNIFMVKDGRIITPCKSSSCLPGITRGIVLKLATEVLSIPTEERRVTLVEFYCADEVFTTGTMGELTPVVDIDGRKIGDGRPGPVTGRVREAFQEMTHREDCGTPLPAPP